MPEPILKNKDLDALVSNSGYRGESGLIDEIMLAKTTGKKIDPAGAFVTFAENNAAVRSGRRIRIVPEESSAFSVNRNIDDAAVASFGNQTLELIIENDDRKKVSDVTESPWKKIAALIITSQNGSKYAGTGWFISPRVLVTAGHCIFLHDAGGFAKEIEVIPAWNGNQKPFGSSSASNFYSSNGWVNDRNSDYDYGLIVLDGKADKRIGWFAFASAPDEYLNGKIVNVSGYPRDPDKYTYQYYHANEIIRSSRHKVYYTADTTGGDSGACLWLSLGENDRVVIGLHTTGGSTTNYGTRITDAMFNNFKKIKDEYK